MIGSASNLCNNIVCRKSHRMIRQNELDNLFLKTYRNPVGKLVDEKEKNNYSVW